MYETSSQLNVTKIQSPYQLIGMVEKKIQLLWPFKRTKYNISKDKKNQWVACNDSFKVVKC